MSLYKRGNTWWYKFRFAGQPIRESAKTASKTVARDAERARRRELELGFNRIPQPKQAPLFRTAAAEWLADKRERAPKTRLGYEQRLKPVRAAFDDRLVCDIGPSEVLDYRAARLRAGASNRTVNYETGCIRGVLKRYGAWASIAEKIRKLPENHSAGRAVSFEDEARLLEACHGSKAPSLLPLVIFARDTGLRASEIKSLRCQDLQLTWKDGLIVAGEVVVPRSKTEAGKGRGVPLQSDVCSTLSLWLARFPKATAESFVFPHHKVRMLKGGRESEIFEVDLKRPMQSWQRAWRTAQNKAGLKDRARYRWHDWRHTMVSRLAENSAVSEQTIRALAGHVSKQMLERYSHIRTQAKQEAIAALQASRERAQREARAAQLEALQEAVRTQ